MKKQNRSFAKFSLVSSPSSKTIHQMSEDKKDAYYSRCNLTSQKSLFAKQYQAFKTFNRHDKFKSLNREAGKELQNLRKELTDCMSCITIEQARNDTFKSLVSLLQSQMREMEQSQKHVKDVENEQTIKRVHKIEYDIEQILQKHNEEIARINNLKQQTASARTDRVVFSNLFRKIEKEIKQHQEHYKQIILKTQIFREKRAKKLINHIDQQEKEARSESEAKEDNLIVSVCKSKSNEENRLFVTCPPEKIKKVSYLSKKNSLRFQSSKDSCNTSKSPITFKIQEIQAKIQKIVKLGQCSSSVQAIDHYRSIFDENQRLSQLIIQEQQKIEEKQAQIDDIKKQQKIKGYYDSRNTGNLQSLTSTRQIRAKTFATQGSEIEDQDIQIMQNIFKELGIPCDQSIEYLISNQDTLADLQNKIQGLTVKDLKNTRKIQNITTHANSNDHELDGIFAKMEKYESCDRIFNKKQLFSEYMKQVGKTKRVIRFRK